MNDGADTPDRSPSLLPPHPAHGPGVRRLNNLPIWFGVGAAMLVAATIGYTYHERLMKTAADAQQSAAHEPEPASGAVVLDHAPISGEVAPAIAGMPEQGPQARHPAQPAQVSPAGPPDMEVNAPRDEDEAAKARNEAWKTYYQRIAELETERLASAQSAMTAETALGQYAGGQTVTPGPLVPPPLASAGPGMTASGAGMSLPDGPAYAEGTGTPAYPLAQVNASAQREKQAFLNQHSDVTGRSDALSMTARDPASPYLIMAGTAISAVMIGGINSDLPGMVIGQVDRSVYDTATGTYLMIPQGARLIGTYDNVVSNGQTRIGVIWNRIIFPDTESLDLGTMEGADQGGHAGFRDQVDTHLWSKIGSAILISIAGAGVQLSQPAPPVSGYYSSQQIATASLGQQFGELGEEYARAGLSVPSSLEIRPGYRFVVMVNKDMHLRPYVDRRAAAGSVPAGIGPVLR